MHRAGLGTLTCLLFGLAGCTQRTADVTPSPAPVTPVAPAPSVSTPIRSGAVTGGQKGYADVVDRVAPAVVTIRSARVMRAPQQFPFLDDPAFRRFFGGRLPEGRSRGEVQRGLGSGVIVNTDGHILTNHHVVDGAEEIDVDLVDQRTFRAKLVGSDAPSDLAVLKIDASGLSVLPLGDSDRVRVGDIALAVGNPLGIGQTVTAGIISAKGRFTGLSNGSFEDFLQTDAPINRGNSGGALVNTSAELIGINSQIVSPSGGNIGIGFAIPSNMARGVMDQLVRSGHVRRGQLGVSISGITPDRAQQLGLKQLRGVLIQEVVRGGPAERAGMQRGDVVTALNGSPVIDSNSFRNHVAQSQPGSEVTLTVLRAGKEQQLRATLGEFTPPVRQAREEDEQ